jgi:hypothetical protein
MLQQPFIVLLEQDGANQPNNAGFIGEDADDVPRRLTSLFNRSNGFVTGMRAGGAGLPAGIQRFWRMVRPSGTEAPGARSVGRPINSMSRELGLVAGRLCDSPGCAESADP